ncbi:hypothetical protein [Fodinicola feengrottensis]|uniref:hypothetical protein n=1 Tax=Fodinicola feengrottensis TaxID=435914 RepID=UPI0013D0C85D|nr:hypothetical protein [Fodinicola feengrottensis]
MTIRVPDVRAEHAAALGRPEAPLADDDEIRRRHREFTASSADLTAALTKTVENDPTRHRCHWCPVCKPRVSADPAGARALFTGGSLVRHLVDYAGLPPHSLVHDADVTDYQLCTFVHAFCLAYPPQNWTPTGRAYAQRWVSTVRHALESDTFENLRSHHFIRRQRERRSPPLGREGNGAEPFRYVREFSGWRGGC